MKINVYADDIYMDKDGRYCTGSCLRDDEIIVYVEMLDVYALGVTHYGTMWDDVETVFKL